MDNKGLQKGVIFDIDGTLLDSNDAHASAFQLAFDAHEVQLKFEEIRKCIGMGSDHLFPALTDIPENSQLGKEISRLKKEIFRTRFLPNLKPFMGSKELVQTLKKRGLRIAVATSAEREELKKNLEILGIQNLVDQQSSADDAENSKPDPDIVSAVIDRLGLARAQLIMIGDTPYDIKAAKGADIACIGFLSGGWTAKDLSGSIATYSGPKDLLDRLDDSPLFLRS